MAHEAMLKQAFERHTQRQRDIFTQISDCVQEIASLNRNSPKQLENSSTQCEIRVKQIDRETSCTEDDTEAKLTGIVTCLDEGQQCDVEATNTSVQTTDLGVVAREDQQSESEVLTELQGVRPTSEWETTILQGPLGPPIRTPGMQELEELTQMCGTGTVTNIQRILLSLERIGTFEEIEPQANGITVAGELNILNNLEFHVGYNNMVQVGPGKREWVVNDPAPYSNLTLAAYVVLICIWKRLGRL